MKLFFRQGAEELAEWMAARNGTSHLDLPGHSLPITRSISDHAQTKRTFSLLPYRHSRARLNHYDVCPPH